MEKTEKEARKLWCPHVRETDENMGTLNRWNVFEYSEGRTDKPIDTGKLNSGCCCIGSACMMWEWGDNRHVDGDYRVGDCGLKRGGRTRL